jgi:thioredoxin 1
MSSMKSRILATVLFFALVCNSCGDGGGSSSNALDLTDATFDALVVKATGPVLVMFYLPTCPHCRNMQEPLSNLARDMASSLKVGRLDAAHNPLMTGRYGIYSVPTFIMFRGGEAVAAIVGKMSEASLYQWAQNVMASGN